MKAKILILALVLVLFLAVVGAALANEGIAFLRWVLGSGASDATAVDVSLRASLGQPVMGVISGGDVTLGQGFWHGGNLSSDDHFIYLPLLLVRSPASLTTLDSVGNVGRYTSIVIGEDGFGLISYYDATNVEIKVAHCEDIACTSATITTLDSAGSLGMATTLGGDGLGLIVYYGDHGLKFAHCNDTACTSATYSVPEVKHGGGYTPSSLSIATGADGLGLITYCAPDPWYSMVYVAHCDNTTCDSVTSKWLWSSERYGGCPTTVMPITIGADGLGLINWGASFTHCSDITCTTTTKSYLADAGFGGTRNSIATGTDGLPLISYVDSNEYLKVAHCIDLVCNSATTATLDSIGALDAHTSITIGTDGLGIISYYDATNKNLKVAHCSDTVCSQASVYILDSTGDVGNDNSIGIGGDGLGLISYYDATNGDLKVAHCGNPFCTP